MRIIVAEVATVVEGTPEAAVAAAAAAEVADRAGEAGRDHGVGRTGRAKEEEGLQTNDHRSGGQVQAQA